MVNHREGTQPSYSLPARLSWTLGTLLGSMPPLLQNLGSSLCIPRWSAGQSSWEPLRKPKPLQTLSIEEREALGAVANTLPC